MNPMKTLVNRMENLLSTGKEADVRFLVGSGAAKKEVRNFCNNMTEEEMLFVVSLLKFLAHKLILTTVSDVFERMFQFDADNGNADRIIEVPDVTPDAFQVLLIYIYADELDGLNQDNDTAVLYAAKKYNIVGLTNACLNCILDTDGVLTALDQARFYLEKHDKLANYEFWNVEEAEGFLEFGKNGLVTVKNKGSRPYGIINALKPLLIKERGIAYYELKIIDFPQSCDLMFGIGQKTMSSSTFYVFKAAWGITTDMYNHIRPSSGDVFGCIVKFSSKEIFITRNGELLQSNSLHIVKLDKPLDMTLAIKLYGDGCSVQLGRIEMSENEGECPF